MLRSLHRLFLRPYRPKRPPSKPVAIVIPLSSRAELTPDEQISLRHLHHHLGRYDRYFLAPEGLRVPFAETEVKRFAPKFFGSVGAHTRLLYWPGFYEAFAEYEFIFFYHLDSLALSDQLLAWCRTGIDYIGPPWLHCADTPWVTRPRVGNCGFALLRVSAALRVLRNRHRAQPITFWLDLFTRESERFAPLVPVLRHWRARFPRLPLVGRLVDEWDRMQNPSPHNRNTDVFWSDKAVRYLPSFRVASFEDGLRFAFEAAPRTCFELNGRRLPFGCHAWPRYDRAFWEPWLLVKREPAPVG